MKKVRKSRTALKVGTNIIHAVVLAPTIYMLLIPTTVEQTFVVRALANASWGWRGLEKSVDLAHR